MGEIDRTRNPAAVIVAGGGSRRMGYDKALLTLPDGRTALASIVDVASRVAAPVFLAVDTAEHADRLAASRFPGLDVLIDREPGGGPLKALAGALHAVTAPLLLLLPVDMPLITPTFLQMLIDAWGAEPREQLVAAAPRAGGVTYPLPACYGSNLVAVVDQLVSSGARALRALLAHPAVRVRLLAEDDLRRVDPALRCLASANTPAEWSDLCARLAPE